MPPRVPSGRPATCVSCVPEPARNVQPPGRASGRPIAFTATGARRDHVLLDEGRRHLQRRRDVVEAVGHVVGRQQLGGVELDARAGRARRSRIPCDSAGAGRPGRADSAGLAARSSESSSQATSESTAAGSGCRAPGGGITRPRILRTAFSNRSACCAMLCARQAVEADAGHLRAVVVAGGAVLLDGGELRVGSRRGRSGPRRLEPPASPAAQRTTLGSATTSSAGQRQRDGGSPRIIAWSCFASSRLRIRRQR